MANGVERRGRWEGYDAAHGFVRDALASLRNLENLLKSPRIGPKALELVVAELRPGIGPLGDAFSMLILLMSERKPGLDVAAVLETFALDRVARLEEAIDRAAKSDMGAKARLQLEAKVVQLGAELDASRDLVDLLNAATAVRPTELDLNALSTEALAKLPPPSKKHPRILHVAYAPAPDSATVVTDPRVVMPLLAMALGLVGSTISKSIVVAATVDDNGGTQLSCRLQSNGQSSTTPCLAPRIIAPSLQVAAGAASLAGAAFAYDETAQQVRIFIPPAHVPKSVVESGASMQE